MNKKMKISLILGGMCVALSCVIAIQVRTISKIGTTTSRNSTENELRDKIGLYSIGIHTDSLTLKNIGTTGFGYANDNSYTYTEYTFVDSKNNEYEMKYINNDDTLDLTEGQKYHVTFEVSEGTFDYEFTIKSIN